MSDHFIELILIVVGLGMIFFRKLLAKQAIGYQNKSMGQNFTQRDVRRSEISNIIIGLLFVVVGVLGMTVLNIFK